ncbi:MAG TPA: hypothetical protein VNJ05_00440 [Sphingomicrobium sp.]|nr:hypothetical protein [Sphingomicrobium sp.]
MRKSIKSLATCASLVSLIAFTAAQLDAAQRRGGGGRAASVSRPSSASASGLRSSARGSVNNAGKGSGSGKWASADRGSISGNKAGNKVNTGNKVNAGNRTNINSGNRTNINTGDINIDRDVDIDVDNGWGCCDGDFDGWGAFYAGAVVGAAVASNYRVGYYYSSLPTNCVIVYRGTVTYYQCGTYWYQPVYSGMNVTYVAVVAP